MKSSIFLLLILLIQLGVKADFSVVNILNYLREGGCYQILALVKKYYGVDVAIDICKAFIPSVDCEEVVRVYISINEARSLDKEDQTKPTLESIIFDNESDIYKNYIYILKTLNKIKAENDILY